MHKKKEEENEGKFQIQKCTKKEKPKIMIVKDKSRFKICNNSTNGIIYILKSKFRIGF
jgi:hypothetical protein